MKLHIAICDNSAADAAYIKDMVLVWSKQSGNPVAIDPFPSSESFLFHYAAHKDYDILLLDIEMGPMNGVSLAKEIRKDNESVQIIFITGYFDYIADGYEVDALQYLIKPVRQDKLFQTMWRAAEKVQKNEQPLLLSLSGETVRVPLYEIRFLEVRQNYVTIHAKSDYSVKKTLGEFAQALDDRFYRLGRSYILNMRYISRITKAEIHLADGTVIPLPRGQYVPLNKAIIAQP